MGSASSTDKAIVKKSTRHGSVEELFEATLRINAQDPYALLGFRKYSSPTKAEVEHAFRIAARQFHPDKVRDFSEEHKQVCRNNFVIISEGKEMLLNPRLKAAYDEKLKRHNKEWSWTDFWDKNGRRLLSGAVLVVGAALLITSMCFTAGGTTPVAAIVALGIVGSAGVAGGTTAGIADYVDPDMSRAKFGAYMVGGAAAGAATAGIAQGIAVGVATAAATKAAATAAASAVVVAEEAAVGAAAAPAIAAAVRVAGTALTTVRVLGGVGMGVGAIAGAATEGLRAYEDVRGHRFCDRIVSRREWTAEYAVYKDATSTDVDPVVFQSLSEFEEEVDAEQRRLRDDCVDDLRHYPERYAAGKLACIMAYTLPTKLYKDLNDTLKMNDPSLLYPLTVFICLFREEMKRLARLPAHERGAGVTAGWYRARQPLWRGTSLRDDELKTWCQEGATFLNPAFMSSSKNRSIAEGFLHRCLASEPKGVYALVEIDCSENFGRNGETYAIDISDKSAMPWEEEVLFYPYSGFRVVSVKPVKTGRLQYRHVKLQAFDTLRVQGHTGYA